MMKVPCMWDDILKLCESLPAVPKSVVLILSG
jgi:hypothetical protein